MARFWSRTLGVGLMAATAIGAAGAAHALTLGPSLDFYQVVSTTDPSPLYATAWAPPLAGVQQPALRGQVQITLAPGSAPVPVIGFGYLSSASGRFDTGNLTFTSIFGVTARAPLFPYPGIGDSGELSSLGCCGTGLGTESFRLVFAGYRLIGPSGSLYSSRPVRQITLSDLPTALGSEFDLSPFVGDPAGVFYVFQTDLPASALLSPVPEPGSALLLTAGLALLARRRLHQRAAHRAVAPTTV